MRTPQSTVLFTGLTLLSAVASAQQADLPRVLIIGDSIYNEPARSVAKELKGKASVTYAAWPQDAVANSSTAFLHLDRLLGRTDKNGTLRPKTEWPAWDMIHVNVGLGDLVYRVPNMESLRLLPIHAGGVVTTGPDQFEKNLDQLISRLNETGAKIVWASITPIRHSRSNVFMPGSEIEYNKIADKIMTRHNIPINDMYTYTRSLMDMNKPASHGADPFNFDKKPIHGAIVDVIVRELKLQRDHPE